MATYVNCYGGSGSEICLFSASIKSDLGSEEAKITRDKICDGCNKCGKININSATISDKAEGPIVKY